jgi:TRAP-type uncharacterized transport system substrate-binding protein
MFLREISTEAPIKLSIAATSKRADIAAIVGAVFFNTADLPRRSQLNIAMGWRDSELGGTGPAVLVDRKKIDFGFGNPAGLSAMAYYGRGFYQNKIPLRAIGVFPTWDRLIFAVRKETGIESLADIKRQKYPLRISTRRRGKLQTTVYAIDQVLRAGGISLAQIERCGGKILEASSPSGADRKSHIHSQAVDAVFDEGVKSWGPAALRANLRFLSIDDSAARHMRWLGFPTAELSGVHYPELEADVRCIDFSGWTFFCHRDLPARTAYAMAEAVDSCHERIPVDHFDKRAMTMDEFCRGGEAGQLNIPLHPGARRYYREKGYL